MCLVILPFNLNVYFASNIRKRDMAYIFISPNTLAAPTLNIFSINIPPGTFSSHPYFSHPHQEVSFSKRECV